jgi:pimeloyl-ACP methyl ester carboxylesterase
VTPPRRRPETDVRHREAQTADGIAIAYTLWSRRAKELLVLAPGFWRVRLGRENLFLANFFVRRGYDVVALDFRGHGDSRGAYTFGTFEANDLKAVLDDLVGEGRPYARFALLGLSMGGTIAADALARWPELPCRALVMVSSPAALRDLRPKPWKAGAIRQVRLRHALKVPRVSRRTRLAATPRGDHAVSHLTMPKLIVTAEGDWLVDPSHGRMLARAAAPPVEDVHLDLPGSLHADALVKYTPLRLLRLLDRWFVRNAPP